jgi:hypothetical protein
MVSSVNGRLSVVPDTEADLPLSGAMGPPLVAVASGALPLPSDGGAIVVVVTVADIAFQFFPRNPHQKCEVYRNDKTSLSKSCLSSQVSSLSGRVLLVTLEADRLWFSKLSILIRKLHCCL